MKNHLAREFAWAAAFDVIEQLRRAGCSMAFEKVFGSIQEAIETAFESAFRVLLHEGTRPMPCTDGVSS